MQFTLGTAAKRLGVSKPTLSKYVKRGDISARKLDSGAYAIDGAELARFETNYRKAEPAPAAAQEAPPASVGVEAELRAQIDRLEAAMAKAEAEAADVKAELKEAREAEREAWRTVAQIKLLEGPVRKGWLERLLGR